MDEHGGAPARAPQPNPFAALVAAGPLEVIKLLLWKARFREPELQAQITEKDINGFYECTAYLKVPTEVKIFQPPGRPAIPEIPASGKRPAIAARPAIPPKAWVQVNLVEAGTDNSVRPVENNEEDYGRQQRTEAVRHARDRVPMMAQRVKNDAAQGVFSASEVNELAEMALLLAQAMRE